MSARKDPTRREDLLFMLLHGGAASNSIANHVVDMAISEALDEQKAEVAGLRARVAELEDYERLSPQQCPKGLHADWLVDSEYAHACPWCRIAELEAAAAHNDLFRSCGCPKRFERHAWRCPTLPAAYDPVPQQRQPEAPAVEFPPVPQQRGES